MKQCLSAKFITLLQDMRFSGGSDYPGLGLQSTTAIASSSSDADVWVDSELTANAPGGSDLHYKGNGHLTNHAPRRRRHQARAVRPGALSGVPNSTPTGQAPLLRREVCPVGVS